MPPLQRAVWISGVSVTAISRGACDTTTACQIYLQDGSYGTIAAGARKAIKFFIASSASTHFTSIAVGDKVDAYGWGWRYNLNGQDEILVQVSAVGNLPGCMHKTGTQTTTPATATLSDLTLANYDVYGPELVKLTSISGKATASPGETFGLYPTGFDGGFGGNTDILSLSPFFLTGSLFTNPPVVPSVVNKFAGLTGVFGLFTPTVDAGAATTYLELYPRTTGGIVHIVDN